jgi:TRAP-type C4-dicarboxylate transport system substrate-binding protein
VTLTLPEVPVAMERGVMDAMFTAGFNVMGAKWYEFIRWAWLPDVSVGGPDYLLMNIEAYNKLSPATRKALDDVAREWGPKMTKNNVESEAGDLAALRDKHKVELIVPPKEQVDRLTDRMRDYWTTWGEQNGPDGVAMVKEIRAALGK